LFGTEIFGFYGLMKAFYFGIAIASIREKNKISAENLPAGWSEKS